MLSDNKFTQEKTKPPKRRAASEVNHRWSDTQKIEAVTTYLLLGSMKATSGALKIPEPTLISWKRTEWWHDLVKEIQAQENLTLSNKLKKIVDKSLDLVADRLDKGDFIYNQKTGEMMRKPVALRDIHRVAVDMTDRRAKLQTTEQHQVSEENIATKLEKLARSFEEFANKQIDIKAPVEVTDVIFGTEVLDAPDSGN